jgi:hypothetical protein
MSVTTLFDFLFYHHIFLQLIGFFLYKIYILLNFLISLFYLLFLILNSYIILALLVLIFRYYSDNYYNFKLNILLANFINNYFEFLYLNNFCKINDYIFIYTKFIRQINHLFFHYIFHSNILTYHRILYFKYYFMIPPIFIYIL